MIYMKVRDLLGGIFVELLKKGVFDMKLEKASKSDVDEIMIIIKKAQSHFKNEGINQWQNNYPNHQVIKDDIEDNNSYVLKQDEIIIGTASVSFEGEETYETIYEGEWLSHDKYAVIHRMAVDFNHRGTGIASIFLKEIEILCINNEIYSIKVDTHRENMPMQKLLLKNGYKECGIIFLKDKNERIAFEKLLN